MGTLNKKKPYSEVYGFPGVKYEQDGRSFNALGDEMVFNASGVLVPAASLPEPEQVNKPAITPPKGELTTEDARQAEINRVWTDLDHESDLPGPGESPGVEETPEALPAGAVEEGEKGNEDPPPIEVPGPPVEEQPKTETPANVTGPGIKVTSALLKNRPKIIEGLDMLGVEYNPKARTKSLYALLKKAVADAAGRGVPAGHSGSTMTWDGGA